MSDVRDLAVWKQLQSPLNCEVECGSVDPCPSTVGWLAAAGSEAYLVAADEAEARGCHGVDKRWDCEKAVDEGCGRGELEFQAREEAAVWLADACRRAAPATNAYRLPSDRVHLILNQ